VGFFGVGVQKTIKKSELHCQTVKNNNNNK